jgi:hypothetical protein
MSHRFVFCGIQDQDLEKMATQRLSRLMDGAPYDSTCAALLEKVDTGYSASIDIYSTLGQFMTRVSAASPRDAVEKALARMTERLKQWQTRRFSTPEPQWFAPKTPDVGVA